jgi:transcriptional regulator with XRE-family HTH domain
MNTDWRTELRGARRKSGLSLKEVAEHSSLSFETVRGYENGRRSPKRASLLKILAILQLTASDANALLEHAGFASEASLYPAHESPQYAFRLDELQRFLDKRPWPAIATDDAIQVLAVNRTMQALWRIDFEREKRRRTTEAMSLFAMIGDYGILDRISNWPEFLSAAASLNKGRPLRAAVTSPEQRLRSAHAMSGGDPKLLKRVVQIWTKAKPAPARIQADFQIVWCDPELGELHFRSVVSVASDVDLLNFRDWHPVDAHTCQALETVRSRRRR